MKIILLRIGATIAIATCIMLAALMLLSGCNAEKQFQKAVNKYGQKESAAFIVGHYPEYFIVKKDSVKDQIITPGFKVDTFATLEALHDTITITKDKVTVKEIYVNGGIQTIVKERVDTIFLKLPCPDVKIPDINKLQVKPNQFPDIRNMVYIIGFLLFLALLFYLWVNRRK